MQMSEHGLELLKQWEGFRNKVYKDSGGKDTIGVGHLLTPTELASGTLAISGATVEWRNDLTDQQVLQLLKQDVAIYEHAVNTDVHVGLQQNQFDALVSFTFNEGTASLATSTLVKDINAGAMGDVPAQFRRWTKVNGVVSQGLVNRREHEIDLWSGRLGDPTTAAPTSAPAPTSPPTNQPATRPGTAYTVAAGDTLASVAATFGTTVAEIAHANDIINPADFKAGRVIVIP